MHWVPTGEKLPFLLSFETHIWQVFILDLAFLPGEFGVVFCWLLPLLFRATFVLCSVFALQQGSVCQAAANVDISIQAADGSTNTTVLVTDPSSSLRLEADSLLEVHNLQVLNGGSLESQGSVSLATALILSGHGSSAVCSTSTCVLTTPLLTVQQNSSLSIDTSASLSVSASGSMQVLNGATVSVSSAGTILGLGSSITVSGLAATFSVAESAIFAPSNNPIQLVALAISDGWLGLCSIPRPLVAVSPFVSPASLLRVSCRGNHVVECGKFFSCGGAASGEWSGWGLSVGRFSVDLAGVFCH